MIHVIVTAYKSFIRHKNVFWLFLGRKWIKTYRTKRSIWQSLNILIYKAECFEAVLLPVLTVSALRGSRCLLDKLLSSWNCGTASLSRSPWNWCSDLSCIPSAPTSGAMTNLEKSMESLIMVFHHYASEDKDGKTLNKKELKKLIQNELPSFLKVRI